jgi:hypothetical protein
MANRMIYTRVYSKGSAGQLASAKASKGDPLSRTDLRDEFRKHANKYNREPTALVSVSDRIVDTVKRAFEKKYEDGESPADISVAFIEIPAATHEEPARVHAARLLAEECRLPEPGLFSHEIIFEWAIPEKYVLHTVSLQTLMDRGLQWEQFCPSGPELQPLSTAELRCCIARDLQHASRGYGPWEVGVYLACFARNFGARAPLDWISHQLFYDCVWTKIIDDDVVRLKYADKYSETVDFDFFCELDHGIETVLYDWWLADIDFFLDYEGFKEWQDVMEDGVEFWDTWHDVSYGETIREIFEKEKLLYNEARNKLLAKHEKIRATVEEKAVMIGL